VKKQYEAERDQTITVIRKNMTEDEVIQLGLKINGTRSAYAQTIDSRADSKRRLSPTPENLIRWMKDPGKYDLIGVDTFERKDATSDYRREIAKQKLFNIFNIKA